MKRIKRRLQKTISMDYQQRGQKKKDKVVLTVLPLISQKE
jgi:hypothetical protein